MLKQEDVLLDVSAFADDAEDVVVEDTGRILYVKNGVEVDCAIISSHGDTPNRVRMPDGNELSYDKFLTHELARLHLLAGKLVDLRPEVNFFVDGDALLTRPGEQSIKNSSVDLLNGECKDVPAFASRVSFLTADAGHGKTALLRHYQHETALSFQQGRSDFLFWHVDLQGRQLLRLSEALMGDLGELRHSGLWMPGIIRLMQRKKLVLAIDGFDELSAEQGDADALGALTSMVGQLQGHGVIIAAARRTFFDAEDYASKTSLIRSRVKSPCYFDQMQLMPWNKNQAITYLTEVTIDGERFDAPSKTYQDVVDALGGNAQHPMLARPFLLSQMAKVLLTSQLAPTDFINSDTDPMSGVKAVVNAFIKREVTEKWIFPDTGAPYLAHDQHIELLAAVAEEMYRMQKDRLRLDTVETLAAMLMDQWSIDAAKRAQIMQMVRAHVLLVLPPDGESSFRSFDHPEFRDFFVAQALLGHLERAMNEGEAGQLTKFLSFAPLTDRTARYVSAMVDRSPEPIKRTLDALCEHVNKEWKPTHLQTNAGTLIASLLDGVQFVHEVVINARLVLSSLVFEGSRLQNVRFEGADFVNLSLQHCTWSGVTLSNCEVTELRVDRKSSHFTNVVIENSRISCVKVAVEGDEDQREYSPTRIRALLKPMGVSLRPQDALITKSVELQENDAIRASRRLLSLFARTTIVTDHMIEQRFRSTGSATAILAKVIPLLVTYGLVEEKPWRGSGSGQAWILLQSLDDILSAIDRPTDPAYGFWRDLTVIAI